MRLGAPGGEGKEERRLGPCEPTFWPQSHRPAHSGARAPEEDGRSQSPRQVLVSVASVAT